MGWISGLYRSILSQEYLRGTSATGKGGWQPKEKMKEEEE
jgi:hypothetical protein